MSRGRPKRSVRDLSSDRPSDEEVDRIFEEIGKMPDVAFAIVFSTQIEKLLEEEILRKLKRNDSKAIKLLTSAGGPISGLYAKTVLAFSMGLIDEATQKNFNIMRNIRNAFAHAPRPITLGVQEILDEMAGIAMPKRIPPICRRFLKDAKGGRVSGRSRYSALCSALYIQLTRNSTVRLQNQLRALKRRYAALLAPEGSRQRVGEYVNALFYLAQKQEQE